MLTLTPLFQQSTLWPIPTAIGISSKDLKILVGAEVLVDLILNCELTNLNFFIGFFNLLLFKGLSLLGVQIGDLFKSSRNFFALSWDLHELGTISSSSGRKGGQILLMYFWVSSRNSRVFLFLLLMFTFIMFFLLRIRSQESGIEACHMYVNFIELSFFTRFVVGVYRLGLAICLYFIVSGRNE